MSCRILTRSPAAQIPRLLFASERAHGVVEISADGRDNGVASDQVAELHTRIVDLERALQTNVRQAREMGFREGEKAGREEASKDSQAALQRLAKSLADLATLRTRIRRESEHELVNLAIAIARRILRREVTVEPDAIFGLVKAALEKVQTRDICRIRVHPDHAAAVRKSLEFAGASAELDADASLQPGDVIVETKRGDTDASVERQLQEIERGFADRLREAG
jgi:flagellar assembly protein FliH